MARIPSPSVTVSVNALNRANGAAFRKDYCESIARKSALRGHVMRAGLMFGQVTHLFEYL